MPDVIQNITRRITKLLALASSPNQAEADAALKKAKELMALHNIRTLDVQEGTNVVNVQYGTVKGYTNQRATWEMRLAAGIARCFDGAAVIHALRDGGWGVTYVASQSELSIILDVYARVRRAISKMSVEYATTNKHLGGMKSIKYNYNLGMVRTVVKRLETLYQSPVTPECTALILVKGDAVQTSVQQLFPRMVNKTIGGQPSQKEAYEQGQRDGHKIQLHKSVQNTQSQMRLNHG